MTITVKGVITLLRVSQAFLSFKYLLVVFFSASAQVRIYFIATFLLHFQVQDSVPYLWHVKTEKHKLARHLQSGEAPLWAWGLWRTAHMSFEKISQKFACIYDEVTVWNLLQCVFRLASLCWEVEKASLYTQCPESSQDTKSLFSFEENQLYISHRHILLKFSPFKFLFSRS